MTNSRLVNTIPVIAKELSENRPRLSVRLILSVWFLIAFIHISPIAIKIHDEMNPKLRMTRVIIPSESINTPSEYNTDPVSRRVGWFGCIKRCEWVYSSNRFEPCPWLWPCPWLCLDLLFLDIWRNNEQNDILIIESKRVAQKV